jgi:hypothetical protein
MICYGVEFPRPYRRFVSLRDYHSLLWFLIKGGHKSGHSSADCTPPPPEDFSPVFVMV